VDDYSLQYGGLILRMQNILEIISILESEMSVKTLLPLTVRPPRCLETPRTENQVTRCQISKERASRPLTCGSLKLANCRLF